MLRGADLDRIFEDGFGDAGFNDPVPDLETKPAKDIAAKNALRAAVQPPRPAAEQVPVVPPAPAKAASQQHVPKPYERPAVYGATPPPPADTELEKYQLEMAMDEAARKKGYTSVQEYEQYLAQSTPAEQQDMPPEQEQLAPGIKKPPAYMPPGAYPGDRTKLGKDYQKENQHDEPEHSPADSSFDMTYVKQMDRQDFARAKDGQTITYRLAEGHDTETAKVGSATLAWALDEAARKLKIGDIVDVVGHEEHAFADNEEYARGAVRRWRFELVSIAGKSVDKFSLAAEDRVARANELRLRGNEMFKKRRLHRALCYYERGSQLMDVLEVEDMGVPGRKDSQAATRNQLIWQCQKPLLLNWGLILKKFGRFREAERKFTEVLMDIDKLNVKALFRRGQCNLHLGNHAQAHSDLTRAAELDTSLAGDVENEMVKIRKMQREQDEEDRPIAKKLVDGFLQAGDARSGAPPPVDAEARPTPTDTLMDILHAQEAAAQSSQVDEDQYCRQREAIYNQFLARPFPTDVDG